jgi:hypothetical protein
MAKVIHNFGRTDKVDKEALTRLVSSFSWILDPAGTNPTVASSGVEIVDSGRLGGAFVLDQLWERLGIAAALRSTAEGGSVSPSSPRVVWNRRRNSPRCAGHMGGWPSAVVRTSTIRPHTQRWTSRWSRCRTSQSGSLPPPYKTCTAISSSTRRPPTPSDMG